MIGVKTCKTCGIEKEIIMENWYLLVRKDGATYCPLICRPCVLKHQKEKQLENHDKYLKYQTEWNRKNKEKRSVDDKKYYRENKDKRKKYMSMYRKTETFKENSSKLYQPKSLMKKHQVNIEEWDACRLYFDYRCAYCGMTYEEHYELYSQDLHKEHLIQGGRNDLKNCVPSCRNCNSEKSESSLNTWYNIHNEKYTRERYLAIYQWIRYDCAKYIQKKKRKRLSKNNT